MPQDILVLGAGMVGTCTALELRLRGYDVVLLDRRPPGEEASYGNAGIIQQEAVVPYAMPRDWRTLLRVLLRRGVDVHVHLAGAVAARSPLRGYWKASAPASHQVLSHQYAGLIRQATGEHERLIGQAGASDLLRRSGLRFVYRNPRALDEAMQEAQRVQQVFGVRSSALDPDSLRTAEPELRGPLVGAVHWLDSWSIADPGALVSRYAGLFQRIGGRLLLGDAGTLRPAGAAWRVDTPDGPVEAAHAVLALGAWTADSLARFGYRWPLFVKRGYHRHYVGGATLNVPTLDADVGYVLAPQLRGLRLTSGAEIAPAHAAPTPRQLVGAARKAAELLDLGRPVEVQPWMGLRPCCADMKPIIGAAPRHRRLWVNCGHGHQGFTLGPASARLLADLIDGRTPYTPSEPFSPARF